MCGEPLAEALEARDGGLHEAAAMIAAPALPEPSPQVPDGTQGLVALARSCSPRLPRLAVAPWWHEEGRVPGCRGLVGGPRVVGAVAADGGDLLALRYLRQQGGEDRAVTV